MFKKIIKAPLVLVRLVFSKEYEEARFLLAEDAMVASKRLWALFTLELASRWVEFSQLLSLLGDKVPVVSSPVSGWVVLATLVAAVGLRIGAFLLQRGKHEPD